MKKPSLYILHGWTYELSKWETITQLLSKKFSVKLLKIPGLTEPLHEVWTLDDYTQWLDTQIPEKTPVVLLGHSNGGRISLNYSLNFPERVSRLILIDSAGIKDKRFKSILKRNVFKYVAKIGRSILPFSLLKEILYKLVRETDYNRADQTLKQTMRNLIIIDLESELKNLSIQTLIIWGEKDRVTPISDAYTMKKLIPKSKLKIISGASHSPMYTHPNEVYKAILKYWNTR